MAIDHQMTKLGITAAAVMLLLGAAACGGSADEFESLEVGQCIQFIESADSDDGTTVGYRVVDCAKAGEFKLQITSVNPTAGCANDEYVEYGSETHRVCVAPVLEVGSCYAPDDVAEWIDAPCDSDEVYFKVEKELSGTDTAECTDADGHFVLPEPAPGKVYCTVAP